MLVFWADAVLSQSQVPSSCLEQRSRRVCKFSILTYVLGVAIRHTIRRLKGSRRFISLKYLGRPHAAIERHEGSSLNTTPCIRTLPVSQGTLITVFIWPQWKGSHNVRGWAFGQGAASDTWLTNRPGICLQTNSGIEALPDKKTSNAAVFDSSSNLIDPPYRRAVSFSIY